MVTLDRLRLIWGLGIGFVMTIAVGPYPIMGLVDDGEIPHRIHNTVGAIQYLPLWALPVILFTLRKDRESAWRIALTSSVVMALVGVWSGDLVASLSWMPLITLIPLWPRLLSWRPNGVSGLALVAAVLCTYVALTEAPELVDLQRLEMGDSHSLRFHFSGMAAAYLALTAAALVTALYRVGVVLRVVVATSAVVAGACSLLWPDYESALVSQKAWTLVLAGVLVGVTRRSSERVSSDELPAEVFIGIYDADATLIGEVGYWIGARLGARHCALCDITHGTFKVKDEWRSCSSGIGAPFMAFHRDDAPQEAVEAANGVYPVVLWHEAGVTRVVMGPDQLEACQGSPEAFTTALMGVLAAKKTA